MLSQKILEALNAQVNAEFWSAYLYLSMSVDAAAKGYKGVANWFAVQFREEQDHAQILMNYILSRGAAVDEQGEEEESANDQIDAREQVEDIKLGIYMIDKELAARTYAQAAPLAGKA